jgi:hypothetical protein
LYVCSFHNGTAGISQTTVKGIGTVIPRIAGGRFRFECVTDKVKSNVVRQGDSYLVKTLLNHLPSLIVAVNDTARLMGNDYKIKRALLAKSDNLLKFVK